MANFLNINGLNIHYKWINHQKETTFVFINSLGTDFRIWDKVVEGLVDVANVLCYDKRGHGLSQTAAMTHGMQSYYEDLVGLLDTLEIQQCIPVGLSVGGRVAMLFAERHPERVQKLILCDTAHKIGTSTSWNQRIEQVNTVGLAGISDAVMEKWFPESFRNTQVSELIGYQTMLERCCPKGYIHCCEAIRDADLTENVQKIQAETLCIVGTEDLSTTPELVKSLVALMPHASLEEIEGSGHIPCVDAPEKLLSLIYTFAFAPSTESLYEIGMKTRRAVLGNAHVDRAEANKIDFDSDFQSYITQSAWGLVWSRPELSKRERSLITIAILASLGHEEELAMHIRATQNTGASVSDVKEVLLHLGIYAGVPCSNSAYKIAKKVYQELEKKGF